MNEDDLDKYQRSGLALAEVRWAEAEGDPERLPRTCYVPIKKGPKAGTMCDRVAGQGTWHVGHGRCVAHGGAKREGRAEGAWSMAHAFARELDCSPWEGLLRAVRIAAGKVAYTEWVLSLASDDLQLEGRRPREVTEKVTEERPDPLSGQVRAVDRIVGTGMFVHPDTGEPLGSGAMRDLSWWVGKNEYWVDKLARYSRAAVDAGVAERLVQQIELQAQTLARVLNAAVEVLDESGTDPQVVALVRSRMRTELLQLDSEGVTVVDGQLVGLDEDGRPM